jgi:RHS repeat-associated protein
MRIAKTVGSDTYNYILSGGTVLADLHGSDWTDYIFVGATRIAKADSFEDRIHIHGTNCSACGSQYSLYAFPSTTSYAGYLIRSGDKLFMRQWQSSGAQGGMQIAFTDGTNTNWAVTDQDGNQLNDDVSQQVWHYRRLDLSQYAGKTIQQIYLVQESKTAAGAWDIYFNDIALNSADGTVRPIYNRQPGISLTMSGTSGVSGRSYEISHASGVTVSPDVTTNYYHSDHLGSALMMSSVNGYPVWQSTYLPFGYEYNSQTGANRYKFSGKEHDAETGLDYFGKRYYGSNIGRFITPDPLNIFALKPEQFTRFIKNPQHWNKYAYVLNNPLAFTDPLGLLEYYAELLKEKIHVHIDDHLSDKQQQALKAKLDAAIGNINQNAGKLTEQERSVVGNIKSIDVDGSAKRSFVLEGKGAFTLSVRDVEQSSKAYLGSDIGHDAFHIQLFNIGGLGMSRGNDAERKAIDFQIDFGKRIGLTGTEVKYLQDYRDQIEKHSDYTNSPVQ